MAGDAPPSQDTVLDPATTESESSQTTLPRPRDEPEPESLLDALERCFQAPLPAPPAPASGASGAPAWISAPPPSIVRAQLEADARYDRMLITRRVHCNETLGVWTRHGDLLDAIEQQTLNDLLFEAREGPIFNLDVLIMRSGRDLTDYQVVTTSPESALRVPAHLKPPCISPQFLHRGAFQPYAHASSERLQHAVDIVSMVLSRGPTTFKIGIARNVEWRWSLYAEEGIYSEMTLLDFSPSFETSVMLETSLISTLSDRIGCQNVGLGGEGARARAERHDTGMFTYVVHSRADLHKRNAAGNRKRKLVSIS